MTGNRAHVLSADHLSHVMLASLPRSQAVKLRNPYDALALLCHACMLAVGFRLVGLNEDHQLEATSEAEDIQPLPHEWNATTSSNYAFRYAHDQSSLQFLIKVSRLGNKAVINGLAIGADKVHSLDVPIQDFMSESSFQFSLDQDIDNSTTISKLENIFISPGRISDFANLLKITIIQRLAPSLQKDGYQESAHAAGQALADARRPPGPGHVAEEPRSDHSIEDTTPPFAQPRPYGDPLAAGPRRPWPAGDFPPPGFEDEYEINRPLGYGPLRGGRRPLNIGERDLYPPGLGPHDPLRGSGYGPLGGFGGGGMHPTFEDPIFGGNGNPGGGGWDSRAPPGARYDPVGPGDGPPHGRHEHRFPGAGGNPRGFGTGNGPNPFAGFGGNDFI